MKWSDFTFSQAIAKVTALYNQLFSATPARFALLDSRGTNVAPYFNDATEAIAYARSVVAGGGKFVIRVFADADGNPIALPAGESVQGLLSEGITWDNAFDVVAGSVSKYNYDFDNDEAEFDAGLSPVHLDFGAETDVP